NATIGFFITIISAYLINVLRICVLAIFIGFPGLIFHIDVMAQPTHDVIGLALLSLGAIPIALWARSRTAQSQVIKQLPKTLIKDAWWLTQERFTFNKAYLAAGLMIMAVVITQIPKKAYDVSRKDLTINIPITLNGEFAVVNALLPKEEAYFTQYGGAAVKASYGDQSLLVVRTSAPLRHLHAPDDCLRGLGMDVEYRGVTYDPIPTAIYKATDDQGIDFRVAVTFVSSDQKYMTTNVSEAVWRWTQNPSEDWIAVQRISKWDDPKHTTFDYAVMASFELPQPKLLNIAQLNGERR
ncbi:MAG: exosortase T, partial [Emcibacteraceae bacterium]|nr:exosortase T [Emcibacteraceae bacterium]